MSVHTPVNEPGVYFITFSVTNGLLKQCRTEKFILQKLTYIHNNPCSGKWMLADRPANYPWSSAGFYDGNKSGYPVKDYLDVLGLVDRQSVIRRVLARLQGQCYRVTRRGRESSGKRIRGREFGEENCFKN